jgi:hypothetical protein
MQPTERQKEMDTIITEIVTDPRNGLDIPVEWFRATENYIEYNIVLAAPIIPGTRPALILTASLN